jgi:hypothetical protein
LETGNLSRFIDSYKKTTPGGRIPKIIGSDFGIPGGVLDLSVSQVVPSQAQTFVEIEEKSFVPSFSIC